MHQTLGSATREFAAAAIIAAALMSCASAPQEAGAAPVKTAPAWTLETPAPDAKYTYFVGYAEGSNDAEAASAADASLIAEILRYIGVTISAETTATARSTLDTFQADLVQTVRQNSTSRVAGFRIAEKYAAPRKNGVTVYVLGKYLTADLNAEKRRIAGIFQEKIDAVAVPEAEGDDLLSDGDAVAAARKFIQAAAAATSSDVENAAIKFERNVNKAKEAIARVTVEKLVDRIEARAGSPFPEPFRAAVLAGGRPIRGAPIVVGYQAKLANGRFTTRTATVVTGSDGVARFDHPAPDFVGKATLTMRIDLSADTEALSGVGGKNASLTAGLEDAIAAKRVSFSYSVVSAARSVPIAVMIVDEDSASGAASSVATAALLEVLAKNGFDAFAAPEVGLAGSDEAAILAAAKKALAEKAERLAYGWTRIVSVKDDAGKKVATVSAEVKVVDLSTGRLLYSSAKRAPAVGDSEREAADAARRILGRTAIGEDLAANLP